MATHYLYAPNAEGQEAEVLKMINGLAKGALGITFAEPTVEALQASELALNPRSTPENMAKNGYVVYTLTVERV